jgi:hypothetical protein
LEAAEEQLEEARSECDLLKSQMTDIDD